MYKRVSTDMNFVQRETEILSFWQAHNIPEKVRNQHPEGEQFTQYDGPPTANGKPHIGHILTRAIKDVIPRHRRMKGRRVAFKAGWDTHGLPVELEVEKLLQINGKPEIERYGLEPFIQHCKESVWKYKDEWEQISARVAYSADMTDPYVTYDNNYIESEWWAIQQIAQKGYLYEGYRIQPYCPRCGTGLASHEVAQGYKEVKETSVFVRFALEDQPNTWFVAWTTTPWTLPSNVALAVHPEAVYAKVRYGGALASDTQAASKPGSCCCGCGCDQTEQAGHSAAEAEGAVKRGILKLDERQVGDYWVALDLVETLFGSQGTVIETCKGRELERLRYRPLFDYAQGVVQQMDKPAYYVTCADYVTLTDGTGIVHIAPAFGEDDAQVGRAYDLPFVQLVREDGTMDEAVTDFAGVFCKDADAGLIQKMAQEASLLAAVPFEHSYPFCWRCDTPLIYYARHAWFIRMSALRDRLVANNDRIDWIPAAIGEGRFGHFIANATDWNLSRERYWGTPLPVWRCDQCGQIHVVGSIDELKQRAVDCPETIELHKPYVDAIELRCPHCEGGIMHRVPEVIDCWFDSGSMPFAQYHYPFENKARFEAQYPAQFISEALDQTRGWFYSLLAISTLIFDRNPFEHVIVLGLVQDKDGLKMSKHKGNVVAPSEAIDLHGADAVRWYFYTNSNPWLPSRFSFEAVAEGQRRFLSTLWNTYAFYILYANLDGFDPTQHRLDSARLGMMDHWVLSRLQSLIETVDQGLERYDITGAARALEAFTDELSNWYVRRCRSRFWAKGMEADKIHAYLTLYTCLETLIRLAAPFIPFLTEAIYQNLVRSVDQAAPESIHLAPYPTVDPTYKDEDLEAQMETVLRLVTLGRAARNEANVKNRQPLAQMLVVDTPALAALSDEARHLILDELNVRALTPVDAADGLIDHRFKPQLKTLGKRFGKQLPLLKQALENLDSQQAWRELQETGELKVIVDGVEQVLAEADLLIETVQRADFSTQQDRELTVALDLNLTDELIEAGLVRELISKIQTMRRDADFEVSDTICVSYETGEKLTAILEKYADQIAEETLTVSFKPCLADQMKTPRAWTINGQPCVLQVEQQA